MYFVIAKGLGKVLNLSSNTAWFKPALTYPIETTIVLAVVVSFIKRAVKPVALAMGI